MTSTIWNSEGKAVKAKMPQQISNWILNYAQL
ncbi:unnamed protein product [Brugia timori]|uniref:DUF3485 domain-containing protein n=1 Tax=Brugia timori TaxID=42155 RepID=A0A0R3R2S3_9BILA|nr:unnamed protein product [Brugia timori]